MEERKLILIIFRMSQMEIRVTTGSGALELNCELITKVNGNVFLKKLYDLSNTFHFRW